LGQAALNVKNVFDVEYFEGAQSRSSVVPGTPFTVFGTVGLRF
jgi:iron complex outermembrane receptor protein